MPGPTTVGTPSSDCNPHIKARSDAIRGAFNSPASHRCTAEQTLQSQSVSLARKRIRTASPNISDTNAGNPTVAGIFLFAPHVASRPARLCNGCIVPRRKAIRCTMKRTPLITLVGAEETLAKTFPATGNAPRSRLRICAQIGSWSVRRQHPYHYPDKLLLPFWTKYTVLGESLRLKIIRRRDRFRMRGQTLRAHRGHDHRRNYHLARGRGEVPHHLREARRALSHPRLGGVARFESAPKTHIEHTSRPARKPSSRPIPKALTPLALTPPWPPPIPRPHPYASTHHRTTGGLPSVASNTCRSRKRLVT